MRVVCSNNAKAEAEWQEVPLPKVEKYEIRVQIEAIGLNRADLLQITGLTPLKIDNPVLGLECSEIIDQVGVDIDEVWLHGKICALLRNNGIADYLVCSQSMPSVVELSLEAGFCETWYTALFNLWNQAKFILKERVYIHAGASGVGISAIQLARFLGAVPYITCGSEKKLQYYLDRHVEAGVLRTQNWAAYFHGLQFDVILDPVEGGYLNKDLSIATNMARIAVIGLLSGIQTKCNFVEFLSKNATVFCRTLTTQSDSVQRLLFAQLDTIFWSAVSRHKVHHGVEQIGMPDEVLDAYRMMQKGDELGTTIV
jgi:NADPH:quinone reductase-like Zn-dependent oxidoreductase